MNSFSFIIKGVSFPKTGLLVSSTSTAAGEKENGLGIDKKVFSFNQVFLLLPFLDPLHLVSLNNTGTKSINLKSTFVLKQYSLYRILWDPEAIGTLPSDPEEYFRKIIFDKLNENLKISFCIKVFTSSRLTKLLFLVNF